MKKIKTDTENSFKEKKKIIIIKKTAQKLE